MLYPMITIDYELFGDGSGSIDRTITSPMEEILKVCSKHEVPVNIMFEFEEYLKIAELDSDRYRKDLKGLEDQIKKMYDSGHDVQLHFHPQFMDARYSEGKWSVDGGAYSIRSIIERPGGPKLIDDELKKGIFTIKQLVDDPSHKVIAYRAGGWNLDPEEAYIKLLKEIGIRIDTSTVKGAVMRSVKHGYDYRSVPSNLGYWWTRPDTISKEGKPGENILEMPIYALNFLPFSPKRLSLMRTMRDKVKGVDYGGGGSFSLKDIYYIMISSIKWDFCKLTADQMEYFYRKALKQQGKTDEVVPLIMIGHTKDFNNLKDFDTFLGKIRTKYYNKFTTFKVLNKLI